MKKILITFILVLTVFQIFAQRSLGFRTGIGVSYSNIGFNEDKSLTNPILNFSIGTGVDLIRKRESYFVRSEIQIARKGYRYKIYNYFNDPKITPSLSITYIQMNVHYGRNLKLYKKIKNKKKSVQSYFGGFLANKITSKWKYNDLAADKSKINKLDAGFLIGLQYSKIIGRSKNKFNVDLRYSHSLTNMLDHPFHSGHLRTFDVGMIYSFEFGKKIRKHPK